MEYSGRSQTKRGRKKREGQSGRSQMRREGEREGKGHSGRSHRKERSKKGIDIAVGVI